MSKKEIDRKIAVIFVADVVGYSQHMKKDEDETLRSFRACKKILEKLFDEHDGRVFNTAGDSILAEFSRAVSAVVCASEIQNLIKERDKFKEKDIVYYDKHAGHGVQYKDILYQVIRSGDVVLID